MFLQMVSFPFFLWLSDIPCCVYVCMCMCTHSSIDGHLDCFSVLAIINIAIINIGMCLSFQVRVFFFSGYMPKSGIARSYGNSTFSLSRNFHADLHSGYTNLHPTNSIGEFPFLHTLSAAATAKSLQSCLTLCSPIDSSPPGSPIPGILQARILEWVAIAFSATPSLAFFICSLFDMAIRIDVR